MQRVFVSSPLVNSLKPAQRKMKAAIVKDLKGANLEPQIFGEEGIPLKMAWSFDKVEQIVRVCDAAVVLAFVRYNYNVHDGMPVKFSSEFNHYEGAPLRFRTNCQY